MDLNDGLKNAFVIVAGMLSVGAAYRKWRDSGKRPAESNAVVTPRRRFPLNAFLIALWITLSPYWWGHMTSDELQPALFPATDPGLLAIARNSISAVLEIFSLGALIWFLGPSVRRDLSDYVDGSPRPEAPKQPLKIAVPSEQQQLKGTTEQKDPVLK